MHSISINEILPEIGQGILCAKIRKNINNNYHDAAIEQIILQLMQKDTLNLLLAEKGFYEYLKANKNTLIAGHAKFTNNNLIDCNQQITKSII